MGEHASRIYQPSQLKRTMNCPGWGRFCDENNILPKPSNKYALKGTAAHYLGERCLKLGKDADHLYGKMITVDDGAGGLVQFECDDDMVNAVQTYLDGIRLKISKMKNAIFLVEEKLDLEWLIPGMFGTGDHIAIEPLAALHVNDYKHGKGVVVEVGKNVGDFEQGSAYGLAAIGKNNPHMVEEVIVTITQPRAYHPDGPVRSVCFEVKELYEWGYDVLKPAIQLAESSEAILKGGSWCKWCDTEDALDIDGQFLCPERRSIAKEAVNSMFDETDIVEINELNIPNPKLFDKDRLSKALDLTDVIKSQIEAIEGEAYKRLENGSEDAPNNRKLVAGSLSNRAWKNGEEVHEVFKTILPRDEIYQPEKVKSPAQLENALAKAKIKPKERNKLIDPLLAERKQGKPVMVPLNDKRTALPPLVEQMFD